MNIDIANSKSACEVGQFPAEYLGPNLGPTFGLFGDHQAGVSGVESVV
jgi:hypothetical protein